MNKSKHYELNTNIKTAWWTQKNIKAVHQTNIIFKKTLNNVL